MTSKTELENREVGAISTVTALGLCTLLAACGGGGGSNTSDTTQSVDNFGLLKPVVSEQELGESLKRGLAGRAAVNGAGGPPLSLDDFADLAGEGAEGFSVTNIQEQGVDEADITKYDGEHLYVLDRSPQTAAGDSLGLSLSFEDSVIRVFRTETESPSAEEVTTIELDSTHGSISGLYLSEVSGNNQLLSLSQTFGPVPWELFSYDYYWQEGKTRVTAWNVDNAEQPELSWTLEFDGSFLTSRKIDNTLYVVTRYTPDVEGVVPFPLDAAEVKANEELINSLEVEALLPDIRLDSQEPQELVHAQDCYLPNPDFEESSVLHSSASIITVTAVDLSNPDNRESVCLNTFASGFYVSKNSLYVTASTNTDSTFVHKIGLNNGAPDYRGSGEVPGYIGTSNPSYLMSESEGDLRVISSSWTGRVFPLPVVELDQTNSQQAAPAEDEDFGIHRLTILREAGDGMRLSAVAQLPNSARPQHIGKPGEDIYAARFLKDRAYAVTFEVIDPLYVLDLSDREDPRVSGELEIPGFSNLLQPLGEELLLGVGSHVPVDAQGLMQGVKVALFNVADIESPVELGSAVIGKRGSSSPAQHSYHALTLLKTGETYRATIPVDRHTTVLPGENTDDNPAYWHAWTDTGLFGFEVDTASGSLRALSPWITEMRSEEKQWPTANTYSSRAVLHDNAVFLSQESRVMAWEWPL